MHDPISGAGPARLGRPLVTTRPEAGAPGFPVTIVGYGIDTAFDPALILDDLMLDPKVRRVGASRLGARTPDYLRLEAGPAIGCFFGSAVGAAGSASRVPGRRGGAA